MAVCIFCNIYTLEEKMSYHFASTLGEYHIATAGGGGNLEEAQNMSHYIIYETGSYNQS